METISFTFNKASFAHHLGIPSSSQLAGQSQHTEQKGRQWENRVNSVTIQISIMYN